MKRRFHLSSSAELKVKLPEVIEEEMNGKPKGFWYDVDLDWIRWLVGEGYENDLGWMRPYLYEVFVDDSRILQIGDVKGLDDFHGKYAKPIMPELETMARIDWPMVAERWSGVETAPYLWERRLTPGYLWYYGWDCASGVIWRGDVLERINLVAKDQNSILKLYKEIHGRGERR